MKINFLTAHPKAACSMFYADAFRSIDCMSYHDNNLEKYDVLLLMTYDHQAAKKIKELYPRSKLGIIDPRNYQVIESVKYCDFLVVDSIEMEDYWRLSKKPIFRYAEYPLIPYLKKEHKEKQTITIGYHGNQIHLDCMSETVTPALEELGKKYKIELAVMYNGDSPSGSEPWYPKNVSVKHIQWSMENYTKELSSCDIGLVPNNMLHDQSEKAERVTNKSYNYSPDDYSLRFKMPSNPGRFITFGMLGIPVVADFYPSALQYLDGSNGYVACNKDGWEYCIEKLILSSDLRQKLGDNLQSLVKEKFDFSKQNKNFLSFLESLF